MKIAIPLCCVAAVLLGIALWGPRRWYRDVTTETRPGAPAPSDSGYALLNRRNWLAALVMVPIAIVVTVDAAKLSEAELHEATSDGVSSLLGTTGSVSLGRVEVAIENQLGAQVDLRLVEQTSEEPDGSVQFEVTKYEKGLDSDDIGPDPAVCVELRTTGQTSPTIDLSSMSSGRCTP